MRYCSLATRVTKAAQLTALRFVNWWCVVVMSHGDDFHLRIPNIKDNSILGL